MTGSNNRQAITIADLRACIDVALRVGIAGGGKVTPQSLVHVRGGRDAFDVLAAGADWFAGHAGLVLNIAPPLWTAT